MEKFAVYFNVSGCGTYKVTRKAAVPITDKKFLFNGGFAGEGTFTLSSAASGTDRIYYLYIAGCGYVSGGPWNWSAAWSNSSQPSAADSAALAPGFVPAEVVAPEAAQPALLDDSYIVEPIMASNAAAPAGIVMPSALAPAGMSEASQDSYSVEPLP